MGAPGHAAARRRVAVVVKGYPRLSETFIAQEILGLERRALALTIVSLRHPTDPAVHPMHREIRAPVLYLPEYLYQEPTRVLWAWQTVRRWPTYPAARRLWLSDLRRDRTSNRGRRFGQAMVLARELPADVGLLYAHYLHTPASVTRYAAVLRGLPWCVSAHAKDIWITPDWEKAEKLRDCACATTCTAAVSWQRWPTTSSTSSRHLPQSSRSTTSKHTPSTSSPHPRASTGSTPGSPRSC